MIIKDFTDNDLYKFTTMNAIQKKFPDAEVVYRFVNRGKPISRQDLPKLYRQKWKRCAD